MHKIIILLQVLVLRVPSLVVSFPSRRRIILVEDDNGDNKIIIMTMPLMEMYCQQSVFVCVIIK